MACGREQVPLLGKRRATEEGQLLGGYSMRMISIRFLQCLLHTCLHSMSTACLPSTLPPQLAALSSSSSSSSFLHMYRVAYVASNQLLLLRTASTRICCWRRLVLPLWLRCWSLSPHQSTHNPGNRFCFIIGRTA